MFLGVPVSAKVKNTVLTESALVHSQGQFCFYVSSSCKLPNKLSRSWTGESQPPTETSLQIFQFLTLPDEFLTLVHLALGNSCVLSHSSALLHRRQANNTLCLLSLLQQT